MTAPTGQRMTALQIALNLAATVQPLAEALDRDPVQGAVLNLGNRGHAAAEMAGNLAVVSIAVDLHQLMGVMLFGGEPPGEDGAITDARTTRDHMRRWAAGDEHHQGEEP